MCFQTGRCGTLPLRDVRVYTDWKQRETDARRSDARDVALCLVTVTLSVVLVISIQNIPFWADSRLVLGNSLSAALYLTVGAWIITPAHQRRLLRSFIHLLVMVAGILSSVALIQSAGSPQFGSQNAGIAVRGIAVALLFLPGWLVSLSVLRHYRTSIDAWNIETIGWNQRIFYGLVGGSALVTYLVVTARFSAIPPAETASTPWYIAQHVMYILGFRSLAEELLFRGILFHLLYRRYNLTLVPATLIVIVLNSLMYVVSIPMATMAPHLVTLFVLGPVVMSALHTVLYVQDGTIVSSFISNVMFQLGYLIFR